MARVLSVGALQVLGPDASLVPFHEHRRVVAGRVRRYAARNDVLSGIERAARGGGAYPLAGLEHLVLDPDGDGFSSHGWTRRSGEGAASSGSGSSPGVAGARGCSPAAGVDCGWRRGWSAACGRRPGRRRAPPGPKATGMLVLPAQRAGEKPGVSGDIVAVRGHRPLALAPGAVAIRPRAQPQLEEEALEPCAHAAVEAEDVLGRGEFQQRSARRVQRAGRHFSRPGRGVLRVVGTEVADVAGLVHGPSVREGCSRGECVQQRELGGGWPRRVCGRQDLAERALRPEG